MANGIPYTSGMAYVQKPNKTARFAIDQGGNTPDCMSLQDLLNMVDDMAPVFMVNGERKCFNINTSNHTIEITSPVTLFTSGMSGVCTIPTGTTGWIGSAISNQGFYYIIADRNGSQATLRVLEEGASSSAWPTMNDPIIVGVFYYNGDDQANPTVQGLSISNDDVTVNGEYIYKSQPAPVASGEMLFVGSSRGAMNIDSVGKTLKITSAGIVVGNSGSAYDITAQSNQWVKGTSIDFAGYYRVYADVGNTDVGNIIVPVRVGASYIAYGTLILIGGFYYDGTEVSGLSFKNDVYVDGNYIYGSAGSSDSLLSTGTRRIVKYGDDLDYLSPDLVLQQNYLNVQNGDALANIKVQNGIMTIDKVTSASATFIGVPMKVMPKMLSYRRVQQGIPPLEVWGLIGYNNPNQVTVVLNGGINNTNFKIYRHQPGTYYFNKVYEGEWITRVSDTVTFGWDGDDLVWMCEGLAQRVPRQTLLDAGAFLDNKCLGFLIGADGSPAMGTNLQVISDCCMRF